MRSQAGTIWFAWRRSAGRVSGLPVRARTWFEARARASVVLGSRYGHARCAPELLEVEVTS